MSKTKPSFDPEKWPRSDDPEVDRVLKFRHSAICILGLDAFRSLHKHGMMVVPCDMVDEKFRPKKTAASSTQIYQSVDQQNLDRPIHHDQ